jgi:hypothetical protein
MNSRQISNVIVVVVILASSLLGESLPVNASAIDGIGLTALSTSAKDESPQRSAASLQFTSGDSVLGFTSQKMYMASLRQALSVEFVDANDVMPLSDTPALTNGKPSPLSKVTYTNLWDGVNVIYESTIGGVAKSSYILAAGANENQIRLRYNVPLEINPDGSLNVRLQDGLMRETAPIAWQMMDGKQTFVDVRFVQYVDNEVGFNLGQYDNRYALTIDPTYIWHTFFGPPTVGGSAGAYSVTVDNSGNVYVVGYSTNPWDVGMTAPLNTYASSYDIVVVKLNSSGVYQWHTFYGGFGDDRALGISVDISGSVYIAGYSSATWNVNTTTPLHAYAGSTDIMVMKLNMDGVYQWHTFFGSSSGDLAYDVRVDNGGNVYVVGYGTATWDVGATMPLNARTGSTRLRKSFTGFR